MVPKRQDESGKRSNQASQSGYSQQPGFPATLSFLKNAVLDEIDSGRSQAVKTPATQSSRSEILRRIRWK